MGMTNVDPNLIVKPEEKCMGKGRIILKQIFIKDCDDVGSQAVFIGCM